MIAVGVCGWIEEGRERKREGGGGRCVQRKKIPAGLALISPRPKIKGVVAMWDPGLCMCFSAEGFWRAGGCWWWWCVFDI